MKVSTSSSIITGSSPIGKNDKSLHTETDNIQQESRRSSRRPAQIVEDLDKTDKIAITATSSIIPMSDIPSSVVIEPETLTNKEMLDTTVEISSSINGRSSATKTDTYTFQSKNGLYYKTYNDYVTANVQYNQQVLKEKGLDTIKSWSTMQNNNKNKRQRKTTTTNVDSEIGNENILITRRSSQRIQSKTKERQEEQQLLILEDIDTIERRIKRQRPTETNSIIYKKSTKKYNNNLSESERTTLCHIDYTIWIKEMEYYLDTIEVLSKPNKRNVLNQIHKLCTGIGITYKHWPSHIIFYYNKNVKLLDTSTFTINLGTDFFSLYNDAVQYENQYGRDLGNGWLLRHPITKLINFQAYYFNKLKEEEDVEQRDIATTTT